jgi:O-antigen/teichoic acid export membrane protein
MTLLFGGDFLGAARPMQILMWSEPFVFMVWVLTNTSVSAGNQRYLLPPALVAVIANIALNFLLIPDRGAVGAAVASLLSYALVLPLSAWMRPLRVLARAFMLAAARPTLAVLLLWLVLRQFQLGLVPAALIVFCGFVGVMILTGGLNRDDLALARRALARGA